MLIGTKRLKKSLKMLIFSVAVFLCHISAHAQNVWVKEHEPARERITKERLEWKIGFLTDTLCQGRATGTRGNTEAAFWIHRQFTNAGLLKFGESYAKRVYIRPGLVGHNIMGMIPGSSKRHKDSYIIIGAHYDHLGILDGKMYPGADSNASGIVALTSLADMFSTMKKGGRTYESNLIFVAFDAKEHSLAGSEALWKMIENGMLKDPVNGKTIRKEDIGFMVNIDQIGTTLVPVRETRRDYIIMLGNESLQPIKQEMINITNRFYSLNMDISLDYYGSENFTKVFYRLSDQRAFVDNKVPAVFFTSGITMNTNKTYDSPSSIDFPILRKRIYLIYHWIDRMI